MKSVSIAVISMAIFLGGCELSEEDRQKLEEASEDIQKLADKIIITAPASGFTVRESLVTVKADVPEDLGAQSVALFVDGVEITTDSDGEPWELEWPAYYFADDQPHTLLLKTTSESGVEVRSTETVQVTVLGEANEALAISGLPTEALQEMYSVSGEVAPFVLASSYQLKYGENVIDLSGTDFEVSDLSVGSHGFSYRAQYQQSETVTLTGPWSKVTTVEVLPPLVPSVTSIQNGDVITTSTVSITPDIPEGLNVDSVILYIDGVSIATDTDGAPWELEWPAYYVSDGQSHTLYVETVSGESSRQSETIEITVDAGANNALAIMGFPDNGTIQDQDTVSGNLAAVSFASYYQLRHGEEILDLDGTDFEVAGLTVGEHEFSYRAISNEFGDQEVVGPWSSTVFIDVLPPVVPEIAAPNVTETDLGFAVSFSWNLISIEDEYMVSYRNLSEESTEYIELIVSGEGSVEVEDLVTGEYEWKLTRENELGHIASSEPVAFVAGIFEKKFGGVGNERIYDVFELANGDILVLAESNSRSIVGSLGVETFWFLRVDRLGNIVAQSFQDIPGAFELHANELTDGNIVVSGTAYESGGHRKGMLMYLSNSLESIWDDVFIYNPTSSKPYLFKSTVEWNNKAFVVGTEYPGESSLEYNPINLFEINFDTAEIESILEIPSIDGLSSFPSDAVVTDDALLIIGTAIPETTSDYYQSGGFLLKLSDDLGVLQSWNDTGEYGHLGIDNLFLHTNGDISVWGGSANGGLVISVLNSTTLTPVYNRENTRRMISSVDSVTSEELVIAYDDFDSVNGNAIHLTNSEHEQLAEYEIQTDYGEIETVKSVFANADHSLLVFFEVLDEGQRDIIVRRIPPLQ